MIADGIFSGITHGEWFSNNDDNVMQESLVCCQRWAIVNCQSRSTLTSITCSERWRRVTRRLYSVWWRSTPREFVWNARLSSCPPWVVMVRLAQVLVYVTTTQHTRYTSDTPLTLCVMWSVVIATQGTGSDLVEVDRLTAASHAWLLVFESSTVDFT